MTDYPKAKIPTDPVLSLASFRQPDAAQIAATALAGEVEPVGPVRRSAHSAQPGQVGQVGQAIPTVLDAGNYVQLTSGRMAIGMALCEMGIGSGDQVLMPAYHSRSMVEPVVWRGAEPVFYRVYADTGVDLDDVAAKLTPASRLLVVVNYFGFAQDLVKLRGFCDAHGLLMLEDCAHAFLGSHAGKPLGSFGDYAIASTMKLFPVYDGGCLISARHRPDRVQLRSAGIRFELKTALNTLERAFAYGRLNVLERVLALPVRAMAGLRRVAKSRTSASVEPIGPKASDGAYGFESQWLDKRASLMSRLVLRLVSKRRVALGRRGNYRRLQAAFAGLPGCRPLYPALPEGVVPWVFPLLVDDPTRIFPLLKHARIPVVRFAEFLWDGVDAAVCPVSVDLSCRVMQFPCHQELREEELVWMIAAVRAIMLTELDVASASASASASHGDVNTGSGATVSANRSPAAP